MGTELIFSIPSTGYGAVTMEYETRRSASGEGLQTLSYTIDTSSWIEIETSAVLDDIPKTHSFDFSISTLKY